MSYAFFLRQHRKCQFKTGNLHITGFVLPGRTRQLPDLFLQIFCLYFLFFRLCRKMNSPLLQSQNLMTLPVPWLPSAPVHPVQLSVARPYCPWFEASLPDTSFPSECPSESQGQAPYTQPDSKRTDRSGSIWQVRFLSM